MDRTAPSFPPALRWSWALVRLGRPWFLAGGLLLFACGAAAALADGARLDLPRLLPALGCVLAAQWMGHYCNDYFDDACDRANRLRTWFSGGSGVLVRQSINRRAAWLAAWILAGLAIACAVIAGRQTPLLLAFGGLGLFLSWAYSAPPLALSGSGWGELAVSLLVAGIVPCTGYTALRGHLPPPTLLLDCLPYLLIHLAMIIAFSIPDHASDAACGKRTLAVRLGLPAAALLHNVLLLAGLAGLLLLGSPAAWFWLPALVAPLVVWQAAVITRCVKTGRGLHALTFRAILIFALSALLWCASLLLSWLRAGPA